MGDQGKADEFKDAGNKLYKEKKFDEAIEQYDKAIAAEPNDFTYYNNKCAVLLEQEKYAECEKILKDILERRYEINTANAGGASYEKAAKVLNRLARCHEKQLKYDDAIQTYKKSLTEDNNRYTRNALRDVESAKDKADKEAYIDVDKAEEHKNKGNEHFKSKEWVKAKEQYDEAIKRNPNDPKIYSNRAAALQKLMAHPDSLRDLDEALKLDPKFVKAYSRKGAAYFFMKDYNKALQSYDEGLQIDPNDAACKDGRTQVMHKIQATAMGADQPDEQQVQESLKDPEIQSILRDPQMGMILKQMQENPQAASEIIAKDAKVKRAVEKLMGAGILRMG